MFRDPALKPDKKLLNLSKSPFSPMKHEVNITALNEIKQIKHLVPWGQDTVCWVAIIEKHVRGRNIADMTKLQSFQNLTRFCAPWFHSKVTTNSLVLSFSFYYSAVKIQISVWPPPCGHATLRPLPSQMLQSQQNTSYPSLISSNSSQRTWGPCPAPKQP